MISNLYIYGAGTRGRKYLDMLNKAGDYAVKGFVDIKAADKKMGGVHSIFS